MGRPALPKVVIIGANGFLGIKCLPFFKKDFEIIAADIEDSCLPPEVGYTHFDLTKPDEVQEVLTREVPELVLLLAAMTDVDKCEIYPEIAFTVNRDGPKNVAKVCHAIGARLIFISTDFIFDGQKKGKYLEEDAPNPISIYGRSKLEAEYTIIQSGCDALICRTAVLYGWPLPGQRDNYASWLVKSLNAGQKVRIVTSQYNTPTLADNLAECLSQMTRFTKTHIYHTVGSTGINRYAFATKLAQVFGFSRELIEPIESFSQKAQRPPYACLSNEKASRDFSVHFATVEEGLVAMKKASAKISYKK